MGRWGEILAFGLGGLAVYAGGWFLFRVSMLALPGEATLGGAWVYVPGLVALGYIAGERRSPRGLLAVIVGYLLPWLVVWTTGLFV